MNSNLQTEEKKTHKKRIKKIPKLISSSFSSLHQNFLKSNRRINDYSKKYLLIISKDNNFYRNINTIYKIHFDLYGFVYSDIQLLFSKYFNIKIKKEVISVLSFINVYSLLSSPIFIVKKSLEFFSNSHNFDTSTYEIEKFNNLVTQTQEVQRKKTNSNTNYISADDLSHISSETIAMQDHVISSLENILYTKYPLIYKDFNKIINDTLYIDALVQFNEIPNIWKKYINKIIALNISVLFYFLSNVEHKFDIIEKASSFLSYVIPYIILSKSINVYDYKLSKFSSKNYFLISKNLIINRKNKYKIINILNSYNKKIVQSIEELFASNKKSVFDIIQSLIKN